MNSIKEIIAAQEIKKVNSNLGYKITAIVVVIVLLYISYQISNEGFISVPIIGGLLNDLLAFISSIIKTIADFFRKFFVFSIII